MAQFMCDRKDRCCPHEFYDSIEQAISDFEDGVPCDHLIEVAPVRNGRWLHHTMIDGHIHAECSECHKVRIIDNYCPNCGARMDGKPT